MELLHRHKVQVSGGPDGRAHRILAHRCAVLVHVSFFFFQAEDGIRDLTVTGVQTCALPISGKNVASSLRIRFNNTLEQSVIFDLRDQVFAALQRLSISYYENRSTGEIMNRVNNDVEHVERIFIDGIESLLMSSLTLIGISVILFSLDWKLAFLSLLPIPVLVYAASYFTNKVHQFYHVVRRSSAELNAYLQDAISGVRETMGFSRQAYEQIGRASCRERV